MVRTRIERHLVSRIGWQRAALLGANDGILFTASLIVGVAAAPPNTSGVFVAGVAGLVAGSMAAGEFVSVSAQYDTEQADLTREKSELSAHTEAEHEELAGIYVKRGVTLDLAQ
jgi:vacuolar iron transporter family protein